MATIELNDDVLYTAALPAGARLFGAQSAAATEPTSFGREAIYNYVSAALAPVASSGSATDLTSGTLPLGRLHAWLADISSIASPATNDVIYFDGTDFVSGPVADASVGALVAANNLSDLASASSARTNLGLAIGTNVQAWDAQLDSLSGASANGVSLVTAADYAAMRALLDLEAGTDFLAPAAIAAAYQPLDADLTTLAGLSKADGNFIVADGSAWTVESGATARASLGLASTTTDDAVVRYNGVSGATQNSGVTISDDNDMAGVRRLTASHSDYAARFVNTQDAASFLEVARFEGDRATPTDGDSMQIGYYLSNDAGTQIEAARMTWVLSDVTAGTEDSALLWMLQVGGSPEYFLRLEPTTLSPASNGLIALGSTSVGWAGLHLETGGVINWANGEVTLTETDANTLTLAGGTLGVPSISVVGVATLGSGGNMTLTPGNPASGPGGNVFDGGILTHEANGNYQVAAYQVKTTSGTLPTWGPISEFVINKTNDQATNFQRISWTAMAAYADSGLADAADDYRLQMESGGAASRLPLKFVSQTNTGADAGFLVEYMTLLADGNVQFFRRTDSPASASSSLEVAIESEKRGTANVLTSNGTLNSPSLRITGKAYDGSLHDADWKFQVSPTSNAGASDLIISNRIDSAGYSSILTLRSSGVVSATTINATTLNATTYNATTVNAGTAGSALGTLTVSGDTSGTISIKPQAAAGTYNFNLPTGAGSSGQLLLSGGGGSSPMAWASSVYVDGSSNLLVGTSSQLTLNGATPAIELVGSAATANVGVLRNTTPGQGGAGMILTSSRGTPATGSFSAIQDNDGLGSFSFGGDDGTLVGEGVSIRAQAEENWTNTSHASRLLFRTCPTGTTTLVERMRIDSVGNVKIGGTAGRGTTAGTNQLVIFDGTAPAGTLANGCSFYSTSGEMRVMDAAGNATLLSPHDRETNEWIYDSIDTRTGRRLTIKMEQMLKALNAQFGWDFVHDRDCD